MALVDPRIPRLSDTVNGRLVDRAIRHAVFLERLKTHQIQKILYFYNRHVFPDLLREYESRIKRAFYKGVDPGPWTTKRLKEVIASAHQQMRVGSRIAYADLRKDLQDIAISESEWQIRALNESVPKSFGLDFRSPSPVLMRQLVDQNPFEGRLTKKWFNDLSAELKTEVQKQASIGLAAGETLPKIVRRIRGAMEITRRHAETIVRTSITHVSNLARQATYAENTDTIKGWQFVATLDSRTTEICMATDGMVFAIGEGAHSYPPLHHQCRSTTAPVLKSWEELGIPGLKEAPAGDRASMTGLVPAKQTYGTWLSQQKTWVQDQALGPGRAKLFRRGTVPISRFVDAKGRPLTLRQLEELEKRMGGSPPAKPRPPKKTPRPTLKDGRQLRLDIERRISTMNKQADLYAKRADKLSEKLKPYYRDPSKMDSEGFKRLNKRYSNYTENLDRLYRIRRTTVQDMLKVNDPIRFDIDHNYAVRRNNELNHAIRAGKNYLSSITSGNKLDRLRVGANRLRRGSRAYSAAGDIYLDPGGSVGTAIHELGHTLEYHGASWFRDRANDFLKKRIAKMPPELQVRERLRDITGIKYGRNEYAWKDKFINPYMGKDYGGRATELISMGVELLYKDPERFIREDAEMFEWLINTLRGID